jgi:hypothetical protein
LKDEDLKKRLEIKRNGKNKNKKRIWSPMKDV